MKKLVKIKIVFLACIMLVVFAAGAVLYDSPTNVNIGINDWTGYYPLIVAEHEKLFEKYGLNAKVQRFNSAQEVLQSMRDGKIHGAGLTLDEAISLNQSGFPVQVVLVIDFSSGGDMIIGQPSITDISMIKGKKIGYEGTLVGEFLLHRALVNNHIKKKAVNLVQVSAKDWLSSFRGGDLDALVCFNPAATTLIEQDGANLLFSSKNIPYEIIDVLVFDKKFYDKNKSQISLVAKAWFDALGVDPDVAATIVAKEKGVSATEYKKSLTQIVVPDLAKNKMLFDEKYNKNIYKYSQVIIDFMMRKGLISSRVNTDQFFTREILDNLSE